VDFESLGHVWKWELPFQSVSKISMCPNSAEISTFERDISIKFFADLIGSKRGCGNWWIMTCRDNYSTFWELIAQMMVNDQRFYVRIINNWGPRSAPLIQNYDEFGILFQHQLPLMLFISQTISKTNCREEPGALPS
jgi:hypothetical protein